MEITLNSNLFWNIPKPDSYSTFNSDMLDNYMYDVPDELKKRYWDHFSRCKWLKKLCEAWAEVICYIFSTIDKDVKIKEPMNISSPRYYNYYTDSCEVQCSMPDSCLEFLEDYAKVKNTKDFERYLKDFNSSRSGFISDMPDSFKELEEYKENDYLRYFSALLDFYVFTELSEELLLVSMCEHIDTSPSEYLNNTEEANEIMAELAEVM